MTKFNRYLYQAVYNDGTVYDQNVEDKSIKDSSKSCFYDIDVARIKYFTLSNGIDAYTLDLRDGGIAVNGSSKFYLTLDELSNFKLVHFRRVRIVKSEQEEVKHVSYILGYDAENSNKQIETHTITIV